MFQTTYKFSSMTQLHSELKSYSIKNNSPYFVKDSRPERFEIRCPSTKKANGDKCDFYLIAHKTGSQEVEITSSNLVHTLTCKENAKAFKQAIKTDISPLLNDFSKIKPNEVINKIKHDYGTSAKYMTVWKAFNDFKSENQKMNDETFAKIKGFMSLFCSQNPGTISSVEINSDNSFK